MFPWSLSGTFLLQLGPVKKWYITNYLTYDEYEYNNEGKFVAGDWLFAGPEVEGYVNGIVKDLSFIRYVMVQPDQSYFRESSFTFGPDGNLTVEEYTYRLMLGSDEKQFEDRSSYTWVYEERGMAR